MKTKKFLNWMLMAALVVGLGATVTACSDDDDDKNEQRNADADPLDTDAAHTAWRWLCAMTDAESLTTGWDKKTYEPTLGKASENNAMTRIVVVKDIEEARKHFASIANVEPSQLSGTYTDSGDGIGNLTWTPSAANAQNLAEVKVDTKLIPHLQKLVYCTVEQEGENGLFSDNVTGTAYYRFGDVVYEKKTASYWVCVRPSFAPDKGDSHWINIYNKTVDSGVADDNLQKKWNKNYGDGNVTIILPTGLKYNREHIYNLANLFFALKNPETYHSTVGDNGKGLGGFDYKYQGEKFLKKVGQYWTKTYPNSGGKSIWKLLFNAENDDIQDIKYPIFYYKGYSWKWGQSITLWRYAPNKYELSYTGKESTDETTTPGGFGFDIRIAAGYPDADFTVTPFKQVDKSSGLGYWLVRYKTGAQLMAQGKYSPYESLNGCEDVYVYNTLTGKQPHDALEEETNIQEPAQPDPEPEVSPALARPQVGALVDKNGKFWKDLASYQNEYGSALANEPIGIVVYMGGNKRVEKGKNYNGLIMAYRDSYHSIIDRDSYEYASDDDSRISYCSTATSKYTMLSRVLDGLANTERLVNANCTAGHIHNAAHYAQNYQQARFVHWGNNFSGFFLPSAGQWILAMEGMGDTWNNNTGEFTKDVSLAKFFDKAGVKKYCPKGYYATSTENSFNMIYGMSIALDGDQGNIELFKKSENCNVRPFIAFKYDDGGTQDPDDVPTEIMEQPSKPGYVLAANGKFYKNASDTRSANTKPVALVVYANSNGRAVESGTDYHGLAINLTELKGAWGQWQTENAKYYSTHTQNMSEIASYKDGIAQTDAAPNNSMAYICRNYNYGYNETFTKDFSKWFLPSAGQWILAAEGLGNKWNGSSQFDKDKSTVFQSFQDAFTKAGLSDYKLKEDLKYWTNTQNSEIYVWTFSKGNGISSINFDQDQRARAFVAFKPNY